MGVEALEAAVLESENVVLTKIASYKEIQVVDPKGWGMEGLEDLQMKKTVAQVT